MAKGDYEVTLDLPTGKSLTFVVPADQTSKYFDNNDPNKPKTDTLFKLAEQGFPKLFEEKRSLESANRYYQGPGRVTITGATKSPAPSTTPRLPLPKPTAPAAAPSEAQIDAYRRRWFKEEASGSIPYQQMNKYLLSADRGNFVFPKGLSEVGKAAIRREVESRIQAQRAAEAGSAAKRAELGRMAQADPFAVTEFGSPYEQQAAVQGLVGEILPSVSRRFTAARTGQQASETLPLGLLPEQKLTPARGAIGTLTRTAGELATPEAMALMASGPAVGGLISQIPALGVAGLAAGAIPSIQAARRGDYGAATVNMLLNLATPELAFRSFRGLNAAQAAMASRMGRTARNIADIEYTPVTAEQYTPVRTNPLALPTGPEGQMSTEGMQRLALPSPPTAIPLPAGPAGQLQMENAARRAAIVSRVMAGEPATYQQPTSGPIVAGSMQAPEVPPTLPTAELLALPPGQSSYPGAAYTPSYQPNFPDMLLGQMQSELKRLVDVRRKLIESNQKVPDRIEDKIRQLTADINYRTQGSEFPRFQQTQQAVKPKSTSPKKKSAVNTEPTEVNTAVTPPAMSVKPPVATQPEAPAAPVMPAEPTVTASTSPSRTRIPRPSTRKPSGTRPTPTAEEGMSEQANQLLRAYQEEKAQQYGFEDEFPQRGSMTQDVKDAVTKVVEDPKERARLLEDIKNTQGNSQALLGLGVNHEVAAVMRQRELIPLINSDNATVAREAVKEYTYLSQVITKGGSKAGFALAMRRLFSYQVDLGQADAYENAVSLLVKTMKANGASDDSIQAAIARMKPRIESGTVLFKNVQGKINGAADAVDAAVAQARAAGRRLTPEEITAAANKKLDALEEKYKPGWVGKSSPWVAPAVREYMNGARKLEQFRARMMDRYGDVIPEDKIDDLFRQAVAKFRNENAPVDEVMRDVSRSVGDEVWNSFSKGQRTLARLKNIQNYERLLVLGLDFGIFGVQFGLAQATRPFLGFGRLAQTEKRTGTEKVFGSVLGGIPSAKDVFSGEKAGGYIPGTIKAFANENAARNIESEIETLGRIRYSEFDNPFAEAGLMGFRKQDIEGGPLSGEFALDTQRVLDDMASWGKWGKMNAALYSRAQRATETGLRYGRALLFDQMMSPFENLPAEEKLAAMKGVANFVNTLTGASTYGQKIENVVKMAGAVQTAPRYYLSNAEMVTGVVPLARTAMAAKGASAKTQALLAKAVAQEYGRIIVTGLAMKPIIESMGGEMVTNPFDPDFGTARFSLTDGTEQTISLLSGREQYIQLAFSLMAKGERPAAGLPLELKSQPWIDKGGRLLSFAYGKSTLIPREIASAAFPVNIPSPVSPGLGY